MNAATAASLIWAIALTVTATVICVTVYKVMTWQRR